MKPKLCACGHEDVDHFDRSFKCRGNNCLCDIFFPASELNIPDNDEINKQLEAIRAQKGGFAAQGKVRSSEGKGGESDDKLGGAPEREGEMVEGERVLSPQEFAALPDHQAALRYLAEGPALPHSKGADRMQEYALRRHWLTTAWLLGASYRQLALLEGVTAASILQAVNKTISKTERQAKRIAWSLEPTALSWYKDQFYTVVIVLPKIPDPVTVAQYLITNLPFQGD